MNTMKKCIWTLLLFLPTLLWAQTDLIKEKWHWNHPLKQDTLAGYTQVLKIENVVYISGTVAINLNEKEVDRVYNHLLKSLESVGASFQNVVKENLYTTDIEAMKQLNHIRKKYYKNDFPAATWVQINRLYMKEAQLEIELIAHLPKSK